MEGGEPGGGHRGEVRKAWIMALVSHRRKL